MNRIVAALGLSFLLAGHAFAGKPVAPKSQLMSANITCGDFLHAPKEVRLQELAWAGGFLSAMTLATAGQWPSGADALHGVNNEVVEAALGGWCTANPRAPFFLAAMELWSDLYGRAAEYFVRQAQ